MSNPHEVLKDLGFAATKIETAEDAASAGMAYARLSTKSDITRCAI